MKKPLVLEIGSGHNPDSRSDILCDRYLNKNFHRSGFLLNYDRPLVISDGQKLPFKDKSFDYIICKQVIEHVDNPEKLIKESSRVAKAGLIICPAAIRERLFGWHKHKWIFTCAKNRLLLTKKPRNFNLYGNFFHSLYQKNIIFRNFCQENEKKLNIYYQWQDKAKIGYIKEMNINLIDRQIASLFKKYNVGDNILRIKTSEFWLRGKNKIKKIWRRSLWKFKNMFNPQINLEYLKDIICCPKCKQNLLLNNIIICNICNSRYKLVKNIPILI